MKTNNKPVIMGILNFTPDSFSDGGNYNSLDSAYKHVKQMIEDGAGIIDIGACSTRPGSIFATEEEEWERLSVILPFMKSEFDIPLSVDTFYTENIKKCLDIGITIINDVGGRFNRAIADDIRNYGASWVLMHGGVNSCEKEGNYPIGIVNSVQQFFDEVLDEASVYGIPKENIILDPGFGFAKNTADNAVLLNSLSMLDTDGSKLLIGLSRKRFIGELSHDDDKTDRLGGTLAANIVSVLSGADIIRTHEIAVHNKAINFVYNLGKTV